MQRALSLDWSPDALSPTTSKNALKKNLKKVEQLKQELQTEISEKSELLDTNAILKTTVDNLNQKLKLKAQENEKLKDDLHDLQLTFERNAEELSSRCSTESEATINNLKSDISECKKYILDLEAENESAKRALERCEQKCSKIADEYVIMENQYEELKSSFALNLERIEQLQQTCKVMKIELSDLKECNQVLKEENLRLEATKSSFSENSECLERELQFQFMKDEIERMTNNLETIEDEQSKLISANVDLTKGKADLIQQQQLLLKENEEAKSRNEKLDLKLASLNEENESLKNVATDLNAKLQDAEKFIRDREQRLEFLMREYKAVEDKLHAERAELQQKYDELNRNNCQLILQLEAEINAKEHCKIALQGCKTKLEAREVEYEVLASKHAEVTSDRDRLADSLEKTAAELSSLRSEKANVENELAAKVKLLQDLQADQISLAEKYEKLAYENEEISCSLAAANDDLVATKETVAELVDRLEETKADCEKMAQENFSLVQCNRTLREEIKRGSSLNKELKTELENEVTELKKVSAEHETLLLDYDVLKKDHSRKIEALRKENKGFKSSNADLLKSNLEYSSQIQNLQSQVQELLSTKETLSEELQICEMKYADLVKDSQKRKSECLNLENLLRQEQKMNAAYHTQVKGLEEKIDKLEVSKNSLSEELARVESSYTESINKLQEELKTSAADLESLSLKNQLLESDSLSLHDTISSMTQKEHLLQQNIETYTEQVSKLQQELSVAIGEKDTLFATSTRLTTENSELLERITSFSHKTESLEKQLEITEETKDALFIEKNELRKTVEELGRQVEEFSASNCTLTEKLKENEHTFTEKLEQLQQDLNRAREEYEELQETNERLLRDNETLVNNLDDIKKESEFLREQVKHLKSDQMVLSQEHQNSLDRIEELMQEVAQITQARGELAEELHRTKESLHEEMGALVTELNVALQESQLQSKKAVSLVQENAALRSQLSDLRLSEQSLQQQLQQLNDERAGAAERCAAYEQTVRKLQADIDDLVISKKFVSEEILAKETVHAQKVEALNTQLEVLLSQRETGVKSNSELEEKNTRLRSEIAKLVEEVQSTRHRFGELEAEKNSLLEREAERTRAIQDLETKVKNLSHSSTSLSTELQMKELEMARKQSEFDEALKFVSQKRDLLASDNSNLASANEELKNRVSLVERENAEAHQQLKDLQEEKSKALAELREMLLHQIDQLHKVNDEMREENRQLVDKNAEKLFCLREVERRFEQLTQEMKDLKEKADGLEAINEQLQHKVKECKDSETRLQDENNRLKEFVNDTESGKEGLLKQIDVLTGNGEQLNKRLQEVTQELEEAKLDQRELRKVIAVESNSNESLKQVNTDLLGRINRLEEEKEKLQAEMQEVSINADSLKQERQDEFQKLTRENVKLRARLDELSAQKEELYKMEKINKDVFENQLQSYTTRNQALQNEVDKLRDLIENTDADMITLKEKIERSEALINELRSSREEEKVKFTAALQDERDRYSKVSSRLESFLKENESISKQLEAEKQRTHNLIHTYELKLQREAETTKSLESRAQNAESCEIESLKKRIEELKRKLEEVVEANECLAGNSKLKTNQHELLLKENENLMQKIDQLERQMATVEQEYDQLLEEKEENRKLNDDMGMQLKNVKELLDGKNGEIKRLSDEYNVFKEEYLKLVQHKGELDKEFKEALLQENAKLSKKCDELSDANLKFVEQLAEKTKMIDSLQAKVTEAASNSSGDEKPDLNETRVVASGPENEVYMKLRHENIKLVEERDKFQKQLAAVTQQLEKEKEAYRSKAQSLYSKISDKMITEYEGKLERAKAEYQKIIKQKYSLQEIEWKKREEEYKLMLKKEKEHIRELSSQMWDISDQYLQLKQKFETKTSPLKYRTFSEETLFSPSTLSRRTKSATQLNLMGGNRGYRVSDFDRRLSTMSEDLPLQMRRRQTISAKVFPCEDEEQEVFDNACLADLKQGRMNIDDSNDFSKQRLSILQQRNSLVPPHLKSSYPAETQFIPPQDFRENDIKMGLTNETDISDIENLIPRDGRDSLRKNRNQTSYKKPGPPTPSKNGGRSSQSEHSGTPRNILKESNDVQQANGRRKSFTPKFLNNLFALRGHATVTIPQDENVPTTPRQNRLSSIRRRFGRNPQELGNTNSGFC